MADTTTDTGVQATAPQATAPQATAPQATAPTSKVVIETPEQSAIPAYRTVVTALASIAMLLASYLFSTNKGWNEFNLRSFDSLCFYTSVIAVGQAGKSTFEALAQGGGWAGVKAAVLTSAKPGG
jgi:hypothetical protein